MNNLPNTLKALAALALLLPLATPAEAALVYHGCANVMPSGPSPFDLVKDLLDQPWSAVREIMEWLLGSPSAEANEVPEGCRTFDPPTLGNDLTQGVPEGEYLNLTNNVVYRYVGPTLTPVGTGTAETGYGVVHAYPEGGRPLPHTGDRRAEPCQHILCVSYTVALIGSTSGVIEVTTNDDCRTRTRSLPLAPSEGGILVHRDRWHVPVDPCTGAGTAVAVLYIDGQPIGMSFTGFTHSNPK